MKSLGLLALVLLAAGCAKAPRSAEEAPLARAVEGASLSPACQSVVGEEWSPSWPVPLPDKGRYALFFYPVTGTPGSGPSVFSPTADAVIESPSGRVLSCAARRGAPALLARQRWPAAIEHGGMEPLREKTARLYEATAAAANSYQGVDPDPALARERARGFLAAFQELEEPALAGEYEKLNPAFWDWVRRQARGG